MDSHKEFGICLIVLIITHYTMARKIIKDVSKCLSYPCLIFNDEFNSLDHTVWEHIISTSATGNGEFQYYANNRTNSFVKDGALYLKPSLTNDTFDDEYLTSGTLDLWGSTPFTQCTTNSDNGCRRTGTKDEIINPIQSAAVRTVKSFSFKYGKIEARVKVPRGDWLWPAVWLMPKYNAYGDWPASGEIDLMESRGNDLLRDDNKTLVGNQRVQQSLHWGPYSPLNGHQKTLGIKNKISGSYADKYHTFGLIWSQKGMEFYIDNKTNLKVSLENESFWEYGKFANENQNAANPWLSGSKMAPFDQEFYIIMNLAVGGTNTYFEESFSPKIPWDNNNDGKAMTDFWEARDQWLPTWNGDDSALKIDYIKVWKLKPSDKDV